MAERRNVARAPKVHFLLIGGGENPVEGQIVNTRTLAAQIFEVEVAFADGLTRRVRPALVELAVGSHPHAVHRKGTRATPRRHGRPLCAVRAYLMRSSGPGR